ncbi:glutamate-5-semialdehyde dehydrogenase [bacterium]|nr:glutamate-5-semialdehyde dehydrogenase [bacterium]
MTNVREICEKVKSASAKIMAASTATKNAALLKIKEKIEANVQSILKHNATDIEAGKQSGINSAFLDRLTLNVSRIDTMCKGIDDVVALPDYVGMVEDSYTLKNGLTVNKVHSPLGVIGIIYEARPNVTVDAAILCIKSGNGVVLKGGKEAINSNRYLVQLMKEAFEECGFDGDAIGFIDGTDRELTKEMLSMDKYIDVVIPRGGETLKKFVLATATMPVIASSGGNCHIFVEKTADLAMAQNIIENAKLSRPSVCNAAETLLVDRAIAKDFLFSCLDKLSKKGVLIKGDKEIKEYYPDAILIDENEYYTEYSDLIIKVKIVDGTEQAINHINKYNTKHSEAIITSDNSQSEEFAVKVDACAVYVNASTRFTDGFELGLGAEMGISTQKLHVRGPIGLKELTSVKYVVKGTGQIR